VETPQRKLLFVFLIICVPLFLNPTLLPSLSWVPGLPERQRRLWFTDLVLRWFSFFPGFVLAALTRSLGQAFLTVVGIFLAILRYRADKRILRWQDGRSIRAVRRHPVSR